MEILQLGSGPMNESILTWNITNWITVVLMALLGFFVLGLLSQAVMKVTGIKSRGMTRGSQSQAAA